MGGKADENSVIMFKARMNRIGEYAAIMPLASSEWGKREELATKVAHTHTHTNNNIKTHTLPGRKAGNLMEV